MANAKKLPSGTWRVVAFVGMVNGKKEYKSFTGTTKAEAEFKATQYITSHKTNIEDIIVDTAIQNYIDSKSNTLSVSTIRGYYVIKNNAIEEIKDLKLCDLDEMTLQRWVNNNAKKYSSKSLRNQFGLITAVIKQQKLPVDTEHIMLKPPVKKEMLIPDKKQMQQILKAVAGTSVELPVTIALMLGLRQSEIAALHWDDYDGEYLHIHRSAVPDKDNKLVEVNRNKSFAGTRTLKVPELLKERLDKAERVSDHISTMLPSSVIRQFKKVCKRVGLPEFTMHAQRHGNASLMLIEGVPDKYAMERLGQSTGHMLKAVYQHTFNDEQKKIADEMNNAFNNLFTQNNTKTDNTNTKDNTEFLENTT